jgi:hypothetical protein
MVRRAMREKFGVPCIYRSIANARSGHRTVDADTATRSQTKNRPMSGGFAG